MGKVNDITWKNLDNYLSDGVFKPAHPGRMIAEIIARRGETLDHAAAEIGVERRKLDRIIDGSAPVTENVAPALGRYAETRPELWLRMQKIFDMWLVREREARQHSSKLTHA